MSEPTYIEVWEVSGNPNGDKLAFAYTERMCPTLDCLEVLRRCMSEMHDCKLEYLIRTDTIELTEKDIKDFKLRKGEE